MLTVNVKKARMNLNQLLNRVEQGEEIMLTRRGKKVACLVSPKRKNSLPSLNEFRKEINHAVNLGSAVLADREEERYS